MSVTTAAAVPFPDDPGGLRIRFAPARRCRWQPPVVAEPVEPMWSPTPIVGYRVWTLKADGVYGSVGHRWAARAPPPRRGFRQVARRRRQAAQDLPERARCAGGPTR